VIQVSIGVHELLFDDVSHLKSVAQSYLVLEVEMVSIPPRNLLTNLRLMILIVLKFDLRLLKHAQFIGELIIYHHARCQFSGVHTALKSSCLHVECISSHLIR